MQEYYSENSKTVWVKFDEIIEIMQYGIKELNSVMAARHNESILIPNRKFYQPKLGARVLVLEPKSHLKSIATHYEGFRKITIYAVNVHAANICATPTTIIEDKTGKVLEIFENVYFPKSLLEFPDRDSIGKIVIRKPNEKHRHYFALIKIEDEGIRKIFETFFKKNLDNHQIRLLDKKMENNNSDDLLRIIINEDKELSKVKEIILNPFYRYFNFLKSET